MKLKVGLGLLVLIFFFSRIVPVAGSPVVSNVSNCTSLVIQPLSLNNVLNGSLQTIRVQIEGSVDSVNALVTEPNSTAVLLQLAYSSASDKYEAVFDQTTQFGQYTVLINATDSCGNTTSSNASFNVLAGDGVPCINAADCFSGYCVRSVCRNATTSCGDSYCDLGEDSNNCPADCPIIDIYPPVVEYIYPPNNSDVNGAFEVDMNVLDNLSGVNDSNLTLVIANSSGIQNESVRIHYGGSYYYTTIDSAPLANGNYTLQVYARDLAGNLNSSEILWVVVNNLPPLESAILISDITECAKGRNTETNYGIWDSTTRTCVLTSDLNGDVEIAASNITLDCNGHIITGMGSGTGILSNSKIGIAIKNCVVQDFYSGIVFSSTDQSLLFNNTAQFNSMHGFNIYHSSYNNLTLNIAQQDSEPGFVGFSIYDNSNYNTLVSNTARNNNMHGFVLSNSHHNNLISNTANDNGQFGFVIATSSSYNNLTSNTAQGNEDSGFKLQDASYNNLTSNTAQNNGRGILLEYAAIGSNYNVISSNIIQYNPTGLLADSSGNHIFNNFFNNTLNARDTSGQNYWNTTKQAGTNILNGPFIGGNYWSDYTGEDLDHDGIGDTNLPYNINLAGIGDFLPLVKPVIVIACSMDSDCNDNNSCTTDTCNNPGTPKSFCSHSNVPSCCGNGVCDSSETYFTCPTDCSLNETFGRLQSKVDVLQNQLDTCQAQIGGIEGRVDVLNTSVSNLNGRVNIVEATVNALTQTVNLLTGRFDALNATMNALTQTVNFLSNTINKIIAYLTNAPQSDRQTMLCGYMKNNNLTSYSDFGLSCTISGKRQTCSCSPI